MVLDIWLSPIGWREMKPVAWSYSALDAFETCPRRYYLTRVSKQVKEPQTDATQWGLRVHKALEVRVDKGIPLPETLKQYEPVAASIVAHREKGAVIRCEQKLSLSKSFKPTTWFEQTTWVRAVVDVSIERGNKAVVLDYKTGKQKEDSAQLRLSAAVVFAHKPAIEKITCGFLWLKDGANTTETFTREQVPDIWNEFLPRVQRLESAMEKQQFPPRPSGLCRAWCPVGRKLCEHCGEG